MKLPEITHPVPVCILHITHPSRAHVPPGETDIRKTWAEYQHDDYELTDSLDWLEVGGFK